MIENFWNTFLEAKGFDKSLRYIEAFHFELREDVANALLELVLKGQKRATCSSLLAYEISGDLIPQQGDYSILTDWNGNPCCVIKTTAVTILPFKEITFDICKREGEDDDLSSWQKGHIHFFRNEGKELGYEFSEDMPVVFEDFDVEFRRMCI